MSYSPLECKDYVKYLNVLIDKNLNWKAHIFLVAFKISMTIGMILNWDSLYPVLLLWSYITPLLPLPRLSNKLVGSSVTANMVDKPLLQKRAIRLINFSPKCEHAIPFFVNLNSGCSFSLRRICFLFNVWCPKQASPCSYSKCIYPCLRYPFLQHQISNYTDKFYVMSSHLEQLKNSFSRFGVRLWNALPQNIKKSARRNVFNKKNTWNTY